MNYGNLKYYQKPQALSTKRLLDQLISQGDLPRELLEGRVLDFGAAHGTNTQAFLNFGGHVDVVDTSKFVHLISKQGILSEENVHHCDGITLLRNRPATYDLIAALMFGPVCSPQDEIFLNEFYKAAKIGIKPSGKILMTSDKGSFQRIAALADHRKGKVVTYQSFPSAYIE